MWRGVCGWRGDRIFGCRHEVLWLRLLRVAGRVRVAVRRILVSRKCEGSHPRHCASHRGHALPGCRVGSCSHGDCASRACLDGAVEADDASDDGGDDDDEEKDEEDDEGGAWSFVIVAVVVVRIGVMVIPEVVVIRCKDVFNFLPRQTVVLVFVRRCV